MYTRFFAWLASWAVGQLWLGSGLAASLLVGSVSTAGAQAVTTIPITTDNTALVLQTDASNRLNTVYFGQPLAAAADYAGVAAQSTFNDANAGFYPNAYTPAGTWNLAEPAIQVTHADGNQSLELHYVRHETKPVQCPFLAYAHPAARP